MTNTQREMLANIRRAAETSLSAAQKRKDSEAVDGFQHIVDDVIRLERDDDCNELYSSQGNWL